MAATKGLDTAAFALAWILLIHVLEANLLNPVIMGSHARMHPVVIIFALLAGEHTFGIWGALLAVPTMSIIQSCFRFYLHEIEGMPGEVEHPHGEWTRRLWKRLKARFGGGGETPRSSGRGRPVIGLAPLVAAGFAEVFSIVVGVLLALAGMAVALMGTFAMIEGARRRGFCALLAGLAGLVVGLWLIGVLA